MAMRLRWAVGLIALLWCLGVAAFAQENSAQPAPEWIAAGGDIGVWVARRDGERVELLLAQRDEDVAGLRRVTQVGEVPAAIIGTQDGPLLFFKARGSGEDRIYPVRLGDFEDRAGIAVLGSLKASTPLRTTDQLVDGVEAGGRVYVHLRSDDRDRGATLLTLERREWVEVPLPVELSDASLDAADVHLLGLSSGLGVLVPGEVQSECVLWSFDAATLGGTAGEGGNGWERSTIEFDLNGEAVAAIGVGDETVVVTSRDGSVECLVLRRQGAIRFASVADTAFPELVTAYDAELWLLDSGAEGAIEARVLSRDGEVLAEGELKLGALRGGEDGFVFLLLMAWAVVISLMVLAMPQNRQVRVVVPPDGYALAEPARRMFAALLDLLPGMVVVSLLWGKPLTWWFGPLSEIVVADGSMPIFALACLTFAYLAIADGVFGRTLGKAMLGCRVMTEDGSVPGLKRGAMRSFFKVFCPPLGVVLLLMPYAPAPWAFGTVVVRRATVRPTDDGPDQDG